MEIRYSERAEKQLDDMDKELRGMFLKHGEKLNRMPPRRHLRFGMPFEVEDVMRQARMVYHIESNVLYVFRCFKGHKEYEKWYKSYK